MNLESVFRIFLLVTFALTALTFLGGYQMARRARVRLARLIAPAYLLANVAVLLGTQGLVKKIGPLVQWEMLCLIGAMFFGFLCGGSWAAVRSDLPPEFVKRARLLFGVTLVMTLIPLTVVAVLNQKVVAAANQLGLDQTTKYEPEKNKDCPENLKSLYTALSLYAQDWDALPPAAKWMENEDLISKVRQNEWLHCPAVSNRQDDKFGYAYNNAVAAKPLNGKPLKEMPDAAKTPLLYDSTELSRSASDAFTSLPQPGRHSGRNNILFCDGHVEAR